MRFLVDECLPIRLSHALTSAGHDATHVVGCGLGGAPDTKVMEQAAAENRVLISADAEDLNAGALIVIGEERIRIRRLPV